MDESKGGHDPEPVAMGVVVDPDAIPRITRASTECPVHQVTVYSDRAEVTRTVAFDVAASGDLEVRVEGLPSCVDVDSVRVDGSGDIVLQEVSYGVHHKVAVQKQPASGDGKDDDTRQDASSVQADLTAVRAELAKIQNRVQEVQRSQKLLEGFTNSVMLRQGEEAPKDPQAAAAFAFALLDQQQSKAAEYNDRLQELAVAVEAKGKLAATLQQRLNELGAAQNPATTASRDVTIVITARSPGQAVLRLSYVVSNASWKPAYDVRIESDSANVQLTYFGMVRQNTGEDWSAAKLVLSTATPSVAGSAPKLPRRGVTIQSPHALRRSLGESMPKSKGIIPTIGFSGGQERFFSSAAVNQRAALMNQSVNHAQAAASRGGGPVSTFHVVRPMTVVSDNKSHKVSVTVIKLRAGFRHYCVPALNPVAYLQCLTTNTSEYTLLASAQVNVFLDNTFVTKTKIDNVAPSESFRTFLGVDSGVTVDYRRVTQTSEMRGYFSKSCVQATAFNTRIKNNKAMPVRVILADILPKSNVTTVKVRLVEPTQAEVDAGNKVEEADRADGTPQAASEAGAAPLSRGVDAVAQLSLTNNLVWSRVVAPGATLDVPFEYEIEHPPGTTIKQYDLTDGGASGRGDTLEGIEKLFGGGGAGPSYMSR